MIQVGSDGAIRVKQNGIVVANSGDPCCCAEPEPQLLCSSCTSGSPTSTVDFNEYDITFSNVSVPPQTCFPCPEAPSSLQVISPGTFSGTFRVRRCSIGCQSVCLAGVPVNSPCVWAAKVPYTQIVARIWGDSSCGTLSGRANEDQDVLELILWRRFLGQPGFSLAATVHKDARPCFQSSPAFLFNSTAAWRCAGGSLANTFTLMYCATGSPTIGTGGSATIVGVPNGLAEDEGIGPEDL